MAVKLSRRNKIGFGILALMMVIGFGFLPESMAIGQHLLFGFKRKFGTHQVRIPLTSFAMSDEGGLSVSVISARGNIRSYLFGREMPTFTTYSQELDSTTGTEKIRNLDKVDKLMHTSTRVKSAIVASQPTVCFEVKHGNPQLAGVLNIYCYPEMEKQGIVVFFAGTDDSAPKFYTNLGLVKN